MIRKIIGLLIVPALLMVGLTACGDSTRNVSSDDYVGVCVDKQGNRVDDSKCNSAPASSNGISASEAFVWYYILSSAIMPSYNSHVYGGYYAPPAGHYAYRGGVPATGGRINYSKFRPKSYSDSYGKTYKAPKSGFGSKSGSYGGSNKKSGFGSGSSGYRKSGSSGFGGGSKSYGGGSRSYGGSRR